MLVGDLFIDHQTLIVLIIKEKILVKIVCCPCTGQRLKDYRLHLRIQFFTLTLQHSCAGMLRAYECPRRRHSESLACICIGVLADMLVHSGNKIMSAELQYTLAVAEEVGRLAGSQRVQVIIEVEVFLIKSINAVKMHLDGIAVECRKMVFWDYILVKNDFQVICISPLRYLRWMGNDKIYIPDERHVDFYSPQKILEGAPVTETFLHHRYIGMLLIIRLPYRIISIYICNDYIHYYLLRSFLICVVLISGVLGR